jgi:hypothetical protein
MAHGHSRNYTTLTDATHVSIQNPSAHTVHLTHVAILYPYRKPRLRDWFVDMVRYKRLSRHIGWCYAYLSIYGVNDGCPVSLEPGKSHEINVLDTELREILRDAIEPYVKFRVYDALWRSKYSARFRYEI